ncbi:hypothetical protein [Alkaliphilus serpentinus]|uniref:dTDP-4-amino-4,6-dideoxygalactose transaminase n=1 Tax=Alkaliphilus serpentinus TaxID=1482731 RepID=A0A833HLQ6_9FIRM|nr:hypothetical protein [Alkaliphilus serpentinus]KAB3526638.1 hypothetical protein F8153_13625 [Alkaliphilus serpentinus]
MKEIGGFFELELGKKPEYHYNALRLNSGRSCLEYILRVRNYKRIYIPVYVCNAVIDVIERNGIDYKFYYLDNGFFPVLNNYKLENNDAILYINYYGLFQNHIYELGLKYNNLIIDNTQAFFSKPIEGIDTFYSARKFFGVADGGYLYVDSDLLLPIIKDISYQRYTHLLKRIDLSAESSYKDYTVNEGLFINEPIKHMSNLTQSILSSIDYSNVITTRDNNFSYLHDIFYKINKLHIEKHQIHGPLCYPLLIDKEGLRDNLLENRIYVATYWKEVLNRALKNSFEYQLAKWLIPIPIDQRYNLEDMSLIASHIKKYLDT